MSAEERLAALIKAAFRASHGPEGPSDLAGDDPHEWMAAWLVKRGVSVPTEPGAPDPECAWCGEPQSHTSHEEEFFGHAFRPIQPVPAPEPSARLREALDTIEAMSGGAADLTDAINEAAALREALKEAVRILSGGRQGYVGDHYIREVQVKQTTVDRLRAALAATPQDPEA